MKTRWSNLAAALSVVPFCATVAQNPRIRAEPEAYIWRDSARFVFALDPVARYVWDIPRPHNYDGFPEYFWEVRWYPDPSAAGRVPMALTLVHGWKPKGPRRGALGELIAGSTLEPLIDCLACDGAALVDPDRDTSTMFAHVENGRVVFRLNGRSAVKHVFPVVPSTVVFEVTNNLGGNGSASNEQSQTVRVNCRPRSVSDSCIVREKTVPNADSAAAENAPRRIYVIVTRFSNATLMHDVLVSIRTLYNKEWARMKTGNPQGFLMLQPPLGPLLLQAHCSQSTLAHPRIFGTAFVNVRPEVDSTVNIIGDPAVCDKQISHDR